MGGWRQAPWRRPSRSRPGSQSRSSPSLNTLHILKPRPPPLHTPQPLHTPPLPPPPPPPPPTLRPPPRSTSPQPTSPKPTQSHKPTPNMRTMNLRLHTSTHCSRNKHGPLHAIGTKNI